MFSNVHQVRSSLRHPKSCLGAHRWRDSSVCGSAAEECIVRGPRTTSNGRSSDPISPYPLRDRPARILPAPAGKIPAPEGGRGEGTDTSILTTTRSQAILPMAPAICNVQSAKIKARVAQKSPRCILGTLVYLGPGCARLLGPGCSKVYSTPGETRVP